MSRVDDVTLGLLDIWRTSTERGIPLPSENTLAEQLGVSRPVIREALIRMEGDGLVRRYRGSATYTNPAALAMPVRLDRATDMADRLDAMGYAVQLEVVIGEVCGVGALAPLPINAEDCHLVIHTMKRWWADGIVAGIVVDHFPVRRGIAHPAPDYERPLGELADEYGLAKPDWLCTWPSAVELDAATASVLEMEPGRAVMRMEHVGVERHGRHVFHSMEHHRSDFIRSGLIRTFED